MSWCCELQAINTTQLLFLVPVAYSSLEISICPALSSQLTQLRSNDDWIEHFWTWFTYFWFIRFYFLVGCCYLLEWRPMVVHGGDFVLYHFSVPGSDVLAIREYKHWWPSMNSSRWGWMCPFKQMDNRLRQDTWYRWVLAAECPCFWDVDDLELFGET